MVIYSNLPADAGQDASGESRATDVDGGQIELQIVPPPDFGTASPAAGDVIELTIVGAEPAEVDWESSDSTVATVDEFGVVTIVGSGEVTITASADGVTVSIDMTVGEREPTELEIPLVPNLDHVVITPATAVIPAGASVVLQALGTLDSGRTLDLTSEVAWSSSDLGVAEVADGLVFGLAEGEAVISARVNDLEATAHITVSQVELETLTVVPERLELAAGLSAQLTLLGTYADGQTLDLTDSANWETNNGAIVSVDASGVVVGLSPGDGRITATWGQHSASSSVSVSDAQLIELDVAPANPLVRVGQSITLVASATYSDGTNVDVSEQAIWTSDNPQLADFVAGSRLSGMAAGETLVRAAFGGAESAVSVTVTSPQVQHLALSPSQLSLPIGASQQLTAIATYDDGESAIVTLDVEWATEGATVASVDEVGMVMANGVGDTVVTATFGQVVASARVSVSDARLSELSANPTEVTLAAGSSRQLSVLASYSDGASHDVTRWVNWRSANGEVASVNAQGVVRGVASGETLITASLDGETTQVVVAVSEALLVDLVLVAQDQRMPAGEATQVTAYAVYSDGSEEAVTQDARWWSSAPEVATVSTGGYVQARAPGQANIHAAYAGLEAQIDLAVTGALLVELVVSPEWVELAAGTEAALTLEARYSDDSLRDVTAQAVWSSVDPDVVQVSAGVVTGITPGETEVRARLGDITTQALVTVSDAVATELVVLAASDAIALGASVQMQAWVTYSNGVTQMVNSATWRSLTPDVASVSAAGLASGHQVGEAEVEATVAGLTATGRFTVTNAVVTELSVSAESEAVAQGNSLQFEAIALYSDGREVVVTEDARWSSSEPGVASVATGLARGIAPGSTRITATYDGHARSVPLTVTAPVLLDLVIEPNPVSLVSGTERELTAVARYSNGATDDVTDQAQWTTSNERVLSVSSGLAVGLEPGDAVVSAVLSEVVASARVTVTAPPLELRVTPTDASLQVGQELQLTALVYDSTTNSSRDVTADVDWESDDADVVSVKAGMLNAIAPGRSQVSAIWQGQTASALVTVARREVSRLTLVPAQLTVNVGQTATMQLLATYTDDSQEDVSSQAQWQTESSAFEVLGGRIRGLTDGNGTVYATFADLETKASVTVVSGELPRLVVTPASIVIAPGQRLAILIEVDDGKQRLDVTLRAKVGTQSARVAGVVTSQSELFVVGESPGATSLVVEYEGMRAEASITVQSADVERQ